MTARRTAALLLATWLVAGPNAQEPTDALHRVVLGDAEQALRDPDPTVRGEAALVLAGTRDPRWHDAVVSVAKDEAEPAHLRGLVALGILGVPGSERVLAKVLDDNSSRVHADGVAAALALGLMPKDAAATEVTRVLTRFLQSNYKRQRDLLGALLLGLAGSDPAAQRQALVRLLDDAANRDPMLRACLVQLLGRLPEALEPARLQSLLERGSPEERLATLQVLREHPQTGDTALIPGIVRLTNSGATPEIRAQALAVLTRMRHLPALDLAARALKAGHAVEVAQGARSALLLGGSSMRGPLEKHILDATNPVLQAAMLLAFRGPLTAEFATACIGIAANRKHGVELRAAAALVLAQAEDARCVPLLRDAFLDADDPELLIQLAKALLRVEPTPPPLERLHKNPRPEDLTGEPHRLVALLVAGHPQALRLVAQCLQRKTTTAEERAELLRAFRLGCQFALPRERARLLPAALQPLFP